MTHSFPTLLDRLHPGLEEAVAEIAHTWRPADPAYRADVYRQILMNLAYAYFVYFHADPEHPDWSPLWNPVFTMQPNPDDIYLYCPVRGDLRYRISGPRGTVKMVTFTVQRGFCGLVDSVAEMGEFADLDDRALHLTPEGEIGLLLAAERPADWSGDWLRLPPTANTLVVRLRAYDWENEVDPNLAIECLDPVPPKPRLAPAEIERRIRELARFPARMARLFYGMQNAIREAVGVNVFQPAPIEGALSRQIYLPAAFELSPGEALLLETDLPRRCHYWNFQLNDPYFNACEYVYRFASINGHQAHISSDGRFRAVIALEDPGAPNWLDPGGFTEGTVYGRWYDASDCPTPSLRRIPLAEVWEWLPPDTPRVSPKERAEQLARRVRAAQRRRRW